MLRPPNTDQLGAGNINGLGGRKRAWRRPQCIELLAEEVRARLLTDAERQELNDAAQVESFSGTRPIHADRCRPFSNNLASVTRALSALAITGPTEGIVSSRGPSSLALFSLRSAVSSAANFGTDRLDLSNKYHQGCACCRGQPPIALVTDDRSQLGQPEQASCRDDAELAQVPAHAVDQLLRWPISCERALCSIDRPCCSIPFTGTNDMLGRVTASQIAAASIASVLPRLT